MGLYGSLITESIYGYNDEFNKTGKVSKPDTSDLKKLRSQLIKAAKSKKFTKADYKRWGNPGYGDGDDERKEKEFSKYKLGFCYCDMGDNYFVYDFTNNCFYFFDHEEIGLDNIKNKKSIEQIAKYIDNDLESYS